MLVLSRRIGETILIDGNITLEVLKCSDGRVKLGVVAPASVRVTRAELVPDQSSTDSWSGCSESALVHV